MNLINRKQLIGLVVAILATLSGCGKSGFDSSLVNERAEQLKATNSFRYPLDDYFPEIPVTDTVPPKIETYRNYHAAEDSYAPPGTPVYAIGNGIIRYSGKSRGYGWLIIIDHPDMDVYSLYGHISTSRWKKLGGEVKKGELIAYLGEAEEGETQVSHIHFGLRIGQKADYPSWGNRRWMAGYTNCRPDQVGWLHPSEIIGETESMRKWKQLIQKRDDIVIGRNLSASDFKITSGKHHAKEDLDQVIRSEFGDNYRLADWHEILAFRTTIEEWADSIGLVEGEINSLLVSNDGYKIWLGRQYYITRFNHNKTREYLAHDSMDDDLVCLGSWFEVNYNLLAVRK